jgi:hypothetical protein
MITSVGLVVAAPVMLIIAAVLSCRTGEVIFRQACVGRGGELFTILKFRSMSSTPKPAKLTLLAFNDGCGALFRLRDDRRITTRLGRNHSMRREPGSTASFSMPSPGSERLGRMWDVGDVVFDSSRYDDGDHPAHQQGMPQRPADRGTRHSSSAPRRPSLGCALGTPGSRRVACHPRPTGHLEEG